MGPGKGLLHHSTLTSFSNHALMKELGSHQVSAFPSASWIMKEQQACWAHVDIWTALAFCKLHLFHVNSKMESSMKEIVTFCEWNQCNCTVDNGKTTPILTVAISPQFWLSVFSDGYSKFSLEGYASGFFEMRCSITGTGFESIFYLTRVLAQPTWTIKWPVCLHGFELWVLW